MEENEGVDDSFLQDDSTIIDLDDESIDSDFEGMSGSASETSQDNTSNPNIASLNTSQTTCDSSSQSPSNLKNVSILSTESLNLQMDTSENINFSQNASITSEVSYNNDNLDSQTSENVVESEIRSDTFSQSTFTSYDISSQNSEISSDWKLSESNQAPIAKVQRDENVLEETNPVKSTLETSGSSDEQSQELGATDSMEKQYGKTGANADISSRSRGQNQEHGTVNVLDGENTRTDAIEKKEDVEKNIEVDHQIEKMKDIEETGIKDDQLKVTNLQSCKSDSENDRLPLDDKLNSDSEMVSNNIEIPVDKNVEKLDTDLMIDLSKSETDVKILTTDVGSSESAEVRLPSKEDNFNHKQTIDMEVEEQIDENCNNNSLSGKRFLDENSSENKNDGALSQSQTEDGIPEITEVETVKNKCAEFDNELDNSDIGPVISLSAVQHITPEEFERMGKGDDLKGIEREKTDQSNSDGVDHEDIDPSEIQSVPVLRTHYNPVNGVPETSSNPELKVVFPVKIKSEPIDTRYEAAMIPKTVSLITSQNTKTTQVVKTPQMTSQTSSSAKLEFGKNSNYLYKVAIQKYASQPKETSQQTRKLPLPERRPVRPIRPQTKPTNNIPQIINVPLRSYSKPANQKKPNPPVIKPNTKSFNVASITQLMQRKHKIGSHKAQPLPPKFKGYLLNYSPATCLECGDSFMSKDTMDMHTERVSLLIEYQCPLCKKKCTFYNKCAFLGHIRMHNKAQAAAKNPAIQVKADILTINMPPRDKVLESLDRTFEPFQTIPIPENPIRCYECGTGFVSMTALADHFGQKQLVCSFHFVCYTCNMVLPTKCSFEAHKRYHSMKSPHTCPECGEDFVNFQEFREHIKNVCYHFCRSAFLQCRSLSGNKCKYKSISLTPMIKHMKSAHIAMTSFQQMENGALRKQNVFSCKICDERRAAWFANSYVTYPEQHVVEEHMMIHLTEIKRNATFCFKCSDCPEKNQAVFTSRDFLITHMRENHRLKTWPLCCSSCNENFDSYPKMLSHQLRVHQLVNSEFYFCSTCKIMFENPELFEKHVCEKSLTFPVKKLEKPNELKEKTQNNIVTKPLRKISPKNVTKINVEPPQGKKTLVTLPEKSTCEICQIEFETKDKFDEHIKTEHSSFPCHLCGLTYDSQQKLETHCQSTHVGDKPGYICYPCKQKSIKRRFNTAIFLEKHLVFKHRISKQRVQRFVNIGRESRRKDAITKRQHGGDMETDVEPETLPVKRLRIEGSGVYACVKCSFSTEDSVEFRKHIESHKTVEANQCPECGLCFSVLPSLKKHLFMVHKIRNADEYIKEKGIEEPEELPPDSEDEELDMSVSPQKKILKDIVPIETGRKKDGPVGELECRVCYKEFENLSLLKNHMRVHGMAFIRSKRAPGNEVKIENDSP